MPTADAVHVRVRKSDSLVNGALVGAAVGFTAGLFVCHTMEPWGTCLRNLDPMLKLGLLGAGIGAGVDFLLRDRLTIYDGGPGAPRIQAAPIVDRRARGMQVSVGF